MGGYFSYCIALQLTLIATDGHRVWNAVRQLNAISTKNDKWRQLKCVWIDWNWFLVRALSFIIFNPYWCPYLFWSIDRSVYPVHNFQEKRFIKIFGIMAYSLFRMAKNWAKSMWFDETKKKNKEPAVRLATKYFSLFFDGLKFAKLIISMRLAFIECAFANDFHTNPNDAINRWFAIKRMIATICAY